MEHTSAIMRLSFCKGEGWEMLRMQIYSMTEVPSEQMKLFGLGLDTGWRTMFPAASINSFGMISAEAWKTLVLDTPGNTDLA